METDTYLKIFFVIAYAKVNSKLSKSRKDKLVGIVVSVPTPCDESYRIKYDQLAEHIKWLIDNGITTGTGVIMVSGGLGEGYFLNMEQFKNVVKTAVEAAEGRVPIMAGVFELNALTAIEKAKYASEVGAEFIQVNPPHYTMPLDEEVYTYYKMINDNADIGIMVYNTPWAAMNFEIRPPLMSKLVELKNVVGIKWSSFDWRNFVECLKLFADKVNFIDNMGTVVGHMRGMKGFISAIANFAPEVELKRWELLKKKDYLSWMEETDRIMAWRREISAAEEIGHRGVGEGTLMKAVLEAAGKPVGPPFPPQKRISKEGIERIRKALRNCGLVK